MLRRRYICVSRTPWPLFDFSGALCVSVNQWVNSQINFSRIAIMVQPLKEEIVALQLESDKATEQKRSIEAQIDDLQRSIARYSLTLTCCWDEMRAVRFAGCLLLLSTRENYNIFALLFLLLVLRLQPVALCFSSTLAWGITEHPVGQRPPGAGGRSTTCNE